MKKHHIALFLLVTILLSTACQKEEVKVLKKVVGTYRMKGFIYHNHPVDSTWVDKDMPLEESPVYKNGVRLMNPSFGSWNMEYSNNYTYISSAGTRMSVEYDALSILPNADIRFFSRYYTLDIGDTLIHSYTGTKQ